MTGTWTLSSGSACAAPLARAAPSSPPGRNANIPDTVAVFGVRLIPVDEKQFVFAVSAKSNTTLPTYFMDRAGAIRVRTGEAASADR